MKLKGWALLFLSLRKPLVFVIFVLLIFGTFLSTFVFAPTVKKAEALGTTYYISPTGTDDGTHGTGSGVNAWATLDYALTGSRVSRGDTIDVDAGTYDTFNGANTHIEPAVGGSGTDPVIIQPTVPGSTVIFNIPANTDTTLAFIWFHPTRWTDLKFQNINFTNTHSINATFAFLFGHILTLQNCNIDMNSTGKRIIYFANDTAGASLTVLRSTVKNISTSYTAIENGRNDGTIPVVDVEDSIIRGSTANYLISTGSAINLTLINDTFLANFYSVAFLNPGSLVKIKNTIFYNRAASSNPPFYFTAGGTAYKDFIDNPTHWDVTNNIWSSSSAIFMTQNSSSNTLYLLPNDVTNHWLNPAFTNPGADDYTITAGSIICGLGSNSDLVSGGDISGAAWTGKDIGAYKCPAATSQRGALLNKVAFEGDSIMLASGTVPSIYTTFKDITGIDYVTPADAAISGTNMQTIFALVDKTITTDLPSTVFLSVGINNLVSSVGAATVTDQQYATYLLSIMTKIQNWGVRPIWLGIGTLNNTSGMNDDRVNAINNLVDAGCVAQGWIYGTYLDQLKLNPNWQSPAPDGYYIADGNVHPSSLGHAVMGQVAEYLYYSHQAIGTGQMDIGAGARIYNNGEFRNLGAVTSNTSANLSILPPSGSFPAGDLSPWMDITNIIWNNTGTHHKAWIETSSVSGLNNTIHAVGDLAPNKYYNVKVDGVLGANMTGGYCTAGLCLADNNGIITFTYTGGYSTHTFDVEAEPATVASSGSSNSSTPTTSSTPVAKFPETGIPPSHNNIPRNIVTLSGLLALVLTSLVVVLRKRRKI